MFTNVNFANMRMLNSITRGWIYGPHARRDIDRFANPNVRIPPPIDRVGFLMQLSTLIKAEDIRKHAKEEAH